MADRPVVIIGISGFGREAADVLNAMGRPIAGFLDDNPSADNLGLLARRRTEFLGEVDRWLLKAEPHEYFVGIGSGHIRHRLADQMDAAGHQASTAIHPSVTLGHGVRIKPGAVICAGVHISNNVEIGRHVHLNPGAVIGHDSSLSDFVSINPSATVSGAVRIGSRTLIGAGAVILQNRIIEADVVIGACALVTKNVPSHATVTGLPGRW